MKILSIKDFIHKCKLKNKTSSLLKLKQVLSSLILNNVEIHLGDGPFESDLGVVNLHPQNRYELDEIH